jgi:two-component system, OmpR family, phosphate regulon response regulator OmpR
VVSILVVDDDERLRSLLDEYLVSRGFEVQTAASGEEALTALSGRPFDLMVLDIMLPGKSGFDICRAVRKTSQIPIVMLTARGEETDRVVGLELGADDYLAKPFSPRELVARIQAVLRRSGASEPEEGSAILSAGPIHLNQDARTVSCHGQAVELTTTEFDILRALLESKGRVVERDALMSKARGDAFASFDRTIDVHISHLRRKLGDDPKRPQLIKTIRGIGYTIARSPE